MIIRHKRFLDVCFETTGDLGNYKTGKWINMGYTKSWYLPSPMDSFEIEDRKDWEKCTNPTQVRCLRNGDWVPL